MDDATNYISYFSLKYQRLTYEYLVAVGISFAYLFMILYTLLNNIGMDMLIRVSMLVLNLLAILLFNIGMRKAYIDSITEMEQKMSELMNVYYPGASSDLKEFGGAAKEISKMLKTGKKKKTR